MFIEFETRVRREQYQDMRRQVQQDRLVRQTSDRRKFAHPGAWMNSWIERLAGWDHPDRHQSWSIHRSEKTTAL